MWRRLSGRNRAIALTGASVLVAGSPSRSQKVQQGWSAKWSQTGQNVTAQNESWNGSLASGASTTIGFNGAWSGSNLKPTQFTLNGTVCNGGTPTTTPPHPGRRWTTRTPG